MIGTDLSAELFEEPGTNLAAELFGGKANNPEYQAGRQAPGWQRGLASVANGPLMGFADEIGGALGGFYDMVTQPKINANDWQRGARPKGLEDFYLANRDALRGMQDVEKKNNPWTTGITQTAASLPLGLLKFGLGGANVVRQAATPVMGTMEKLFRTAATGMGYGAVGGAGNSEADSVGGLLADTALGGATGAVLAPVVGGAANVIGAGVGYVRQRFSQAAANQAAQEKVAEALARDARGTLFTSGQANPVNQAVRRFDQLTEPTTTRNWPSFFVPRREPDNLPNWANWQPTVALADAGGASTRKLLDQVVTLPGRSAEAASQLLRQRQASVGARMRADADSALGTQGQRLSDTVESLISQREQASGPLYAQLHQVDVAATPRLASILQAADDLGATKLGQKIATGYELPWTLDLNNPSRFAMRDLDHVKQGLDKMLSSREALDANGKLNTLGTSYLNLKNKLIGELDQATTNPQTGNSMYRTARNAFAGPSALMDAASAGRRAVNMDEAGVQQLVRGLSSSEQEAFRIGAFEGLRQKLGTQGGQTSIMSMWKNPSTQEQLKTIFGDERSFRLFAANTAREASLKQLQSVGQGSQTASRLAGMADLDNPALSSAAGAISAVQSGNPVGMAAAAGNLWNRVKTPETVRNQIGQLLLSQGQQGRSNLVNMKDLIDRINQQSALLNQTTGQIGSQIGSQLAPRMYVPGGLLGN